MKKIITFLLALSMVISLLPATLAADTTADSGITVTYNMQINSISTSSWAKIALATLDETNGFWYFYDETNKNTGTNLRYSRIYATSYGGKDGFLALAINVPVAGNYEILFDYYQMKQQGCVGGVYILPLTSDYDTRTEIDTALKAGTGLLKKDIEYFGTNEKEVKDVNLGTKYFAKGEYLVVYRHESDGTNVANATSFDTNYMHPGKLTLKGGTSSVTMLHKVSLADEDATIAKDETTQVNITAFDSETAAASTTGITYSSSNEKVATVDENGLVTGVGMGKATITVTSKNEAVGYSDSKTVDVTVAGTGPKVTYDMTPDVFTDRNTQLSSIDYADTHGFWEYFYFTTSAGNINGLKTDRNYGYLSLYSYGGQNGFVALKINVPVAGDYKILQNYAKAADGAEKAGMYILPGNTEKANIKNLISDNTYLINDTINCYNSSGKTVCTEYDFGTKYFDKGEHIIVYKQISEGNKGMCIGDITLNGGTGTAYVGLVTAENTELKVGESITPTAAVYNSSTGAAITSGVTLTSSNPAVAVIDGTTVKAVGAGKTTISVTCTNPSVGNVIGTEITVTAPENAEYIAAFNPDDTGSETVNEVVSPLVYAKDGTKLNITPSAIKVGNVWQVSTDAESGDYKFLYWAKGLSTGVKRRIVSRSASFNYDAENEGNYLIAVYEKENMKTNGDEYYNANGQLLENGDTLPYLAGYVGAATGWKDRGDGMHVAIFPEENRAKYTITVDGTPKDYYYGEPVVCTADAEKDGQKFFGWKKTVNNAPAELVSASTSYIFNAWEACTVTPVYETEKAVFNGVARKIVLGTFNVGNETAIMAEFIGFGDDVVERGISLNGTEIAMTTKEYNQFTIINNDNVANISGYAILADGTKLIYNK